MDALAAREAYLYGYYGIPDKLLSRHPLFYTALPDSRQQEIYDIGKNARDRQIETKWQKMQEKKNAAALPKIPELADVEEGVSWAEEDATAKHGEENLDTAADAAAPEAENIQPEDELPVEESAERGIIKERDTTKGIGIQYFAKMPKEKFAGYSLNPEKAPDKAKAFKEALGYDLSNYELLMQDINDHIDESKFVEKGDDGFGMCFQYVIELEGPNGKKANVVTAWIQDGDDKRLTSVYVTKKKVKNENRAI